MSIHEYQTVFKGDGDYKTKHAISLEPQPEKEHEARVIHIQEPITYHYLTFETTLPPFSRLFSTSLDGLPAPKPPNLTHYLSIRLARVPQEDRYISVLYGLHVCLLRTWLLRRRMGANQQAMGCEPDGRLPWYHHVHARFWNRSYGARPFSELNGRKPVFVVTGILFCVSQLGCAVTRSFPGMLVARFFVGVGGSTFSSTIGGVISDIYHKDDRNTPMALFACSSMFGTGLGPLVSGFVAQNLDWRWVFWVQAVTCGACILAVTTFSGKPEAV